MCVACLRRWEGGGARPPPSSTPVQPCPSLRLSPPSAARASAQVQPRLFDQLLSKRVLREEVYATLMRDDDPDEYRKQFWSETTTEHFQFVLLSKRPIPPEWCAACTPERAFARV